jgi:hypothetical protein
VESERGRAGAIWGALSHAIAKWEAQRGDRAASEAALQEGRRSLEAFARRTSMPEEVLEKWMESVRSTERRMKLAFDEDAAVLELAAEAVARLDRLSNGDRHPVTSAVLLCRKRQVLSDATVAALKLDRLAAADTTARALLALPLPSSVFSDRALLEQPDDLGWARVLLAQVQIAQGHSPEALKTLEPALALYREMKGRGADHLTFRQHFARAFYVHALAQMTDATGSAQRRDSLAEAAKVLAELTGDARQLHDTKELLGWIEAEQKNLNPQ